MPQERNRAATVIAHEGDRVQVQHKGETLTASARGFPEGFKLSPGSRVILADEAAGLVARPLVRALTAKFPVETVEKRGSLEVEGRRLEMQAGTVLDARDRQELKGLAAEYEVWVADRGEGQPASQVVAAICRRQ